MGSEGATPTTQTTHHFKIMLPEQDFPSVVPGQDYQTDAVEDVARNVFINTTICVIGSSIPGVSRGKSWVTQANASTALGETIEEIKGSEEQNAVSNTTKNL